MKHAAPRLTPSRTDAQQWVPEILKELGMVDALRRRGIACDIELHPATGMAIIAVPVQGEATQYVMVYDPLDAATELEIASRVAAFFRQTDVFIDYDDPRDPIDRVEEGAPVGDDEPCSLETRIIAELIAVTGREPDSLTFNDDGALDQVARLYVEAGGPEVARHVGTSLPWEEQRESLDCIDWIDRFWGLDDWCKSDGVGLDGLRALCDRAVARLTRA